MAIRRTRQLVLAFIILTVPTVTQAIRFDWTPAEIACANSIGVDLDRTTDPSSPTFVRHLTWIADAIIYGRVADIEHDITGVYKTLVKVTVLSVKKGAIEASAIYVNLESGPTYDSTRHLIMQSTLVGEPDFRIDENVLLFLTAGYHDLPGYALEEGHWRLVDNVKWLVEGSVVQQVGVPANNYSIGWMNSEIDVTKNAQNSNCQ